jgi:putative Mn2+ efflux pump MntP
MSFATLALIAIGVSADAFAVALARGLAMTRLDRRQLVALAVTFGGFQALMPLVGWAVAGTFADQITAIDHWVAFVLLGAIGAVMIREGLGGEDDEGGEGDEGVGDGGRTGLVGLLVLGVATSIDALAVGISFAFLDVDIVPAVVLIGLTTAAFTAVGVVIGHRAGARFRGPAEVVGGLILIGIGLRVLLSHLGVW